MIVWKALLEGGIDIYPEYTGTITAEILKKPELEDISKIRKELEDKYKISMTNPLGFNNTYAIVMRRKQAEELDITKISDLRNHPELKIGVSHEYLNRKDGWKDLKKKYHLPFVGVKGFQHDLAYKALASGGIDITDAYSTDAKIEKNGFIVLEDDLNFFPKYEAVILYKSDLEDNKLKSIGDLESKIDESLMMNLNLIAETDKSIINASREFFLRVYPNDKREIKEDTIVDIVIDRGREHLF